MFVRPLVRFLAVSLLVLLGTRFSTATDLKIVGWNLESGEASRTFLSNHIADFQGVDLWGFTEVLANDAAAFASACAVGESNNQFQYILGRTGQTDRMVIVYNKTKLELLERGEKMDLSAQTGRAPLFGVFKVRATGEEFLFMVNHLHRTNPTKRMQQATGLRDWARTEPRPLIMVGDYNCDIDPDVPNDRGNSSHREMMRYNVFKAVKPNPNRATHKQGSILDLTLLGGPAKTWPTTSQVVVLSDDNTDDHRSSDHRPLQAIISTVAPLPTPHGGGIALRLSPVPGATAQPGVTARAIRPMSMTNELPEVLPVSGAETATRGATLRGTTSDREKLLDDIDRMQKDLADLRERVKNLK